MPTRIRRLARTRVNVCPRCATALERVVRKRYEPFWIVLVICLGAALVFYLVGILIVATGVWLWTRQTWGWACPACAQEQSPTSLRL